MYWKLLPGHTLSYSSDAQYDEHFSYLIQDAVSFCCRQSSGSIALEYSGGLDTSCILTTLDKLKQPTALLMHSNPDKPSEEREYGERLLNHLTHFYKLYYIDETGFDPIRVLDKCKSWFAGGAPFLFFMLANNIHSFTVAHGYDTLLSGFGGDECVSSHAPLSIYSSMKGYKIAKKCVINQNSSHHSLQQSLRALRLILSAQYQSFQHKECDFLQGKKSYHVRMRIEYSAILANAMGFRYQYPLLHPPLVEFCFRLPVEQKRRMLDNRLIMKRYLNQSIGSTLFDNHKKCGDILPATLIHCQNQYKSGAFQPYFKDLPYQALKNKLFKRGLIPEERLFHLDFMRYMFNEML